VRKYTSSHVVAREDERMIRKPWLMAERIEASSHMAGREYEKWVESRL
jgi:hypothetical protein